MNKLIIAATLLMSSQAVAIERDTCNNLTEMAGIAMEMRQSGINVTGLYNAIDRAEVSDSVKEITRVVILSAQGYPRHKTDQLKQHAVTEYRNTVLQLCLSTGE